MCSSDLCYKCGEAEVVVGRATSVVNQVTWLGSAPRRVVEAEGGEVVDEEEEAVVETVTNVGSLGILRENALPALLEVHCLLPYMVVYIFCRCILFYILISRFCCAIALRRCLLDLIICSYSSFLCFLINNRFGIILFMCRDMVGF